MPQNQGFTCFRRLRCGSALDSGAASEISIGDILRYQPNLRRSKWWGETNIALPGLVPCFHMFPWTSGSSRSRSTPNSCPNRTEVQEMPLIAHIARNLPQEFPEFPRHHFSIPDSSKCGDAIFCWVISTLPRGSTGKPSTNRPCSTPLIAPLWTNLGCQWRKNLQQKDYEFQHFFTHTYSINIIYSYIIWYNYITHTHIYIYIHTALIFIDGGFHQWYPNSWMVFPMGKNTDRVHWDPSVWTPNRPTSSAALQPDVKKLGS